ncbi:N-carbamoyl-L-amino acid hydrolase [Vibrio ishigakensis]|uniref:N-carbamoyl-L-amino acid hydrolase n=1 Tax=Vibrio ishigakensis TaxID=1481914 RepID=A0A0B8PNT4_9VIBR|nr:N-carbamoyl-L-amino acid hydrolase [Vibrio ishigakensis]
MTRTDSNIIMQRADELAQFTSTPGALTRTYLSKQHKQAHQALSEWMDQAGLDTWQDSVGNQWGRKVSANPTQPTLIIGSHSDTVVNAGKYDGNLGILLAISVLQYLKDIELPFHVDIVAFADEEGTRFDTTLIGSSATAGVFQPDWLEVQDKQGTSMAEAMLEFGLDPKKVGLDARKPSEVQAYLEVHIEQGPVLEAEDRAVGVVTGIAGAKRYQFAVKGMAGHAGTVPLEMRADALCGMAQMTLAIETFAKQNGLVATVGKCELPSGSVNVIPGEVRFTLDIRSLDQAKLDKSCEALLAQLDDIAEQRGLSLKSELFYEAESVPCAESLQQLWGSAVELSTKQSPLFLASGAGHDALAMAHLTEVGMLFVRCDKGISHNPREAVNVQDVEVALDCLKQMLLLLKERADG